MSIVAHFHSSYIYECIHSPNMLLIMISFENDRVIRFTYNSFSLADCLGVSLFCFQFESFQSWRFRTFTNYHWWPLKILSERHITKPSLRRCVIFSSLSLHKSQKIIINLYFVHWFRFSLCMDFRTRSGRSAFALRLFKQKKYTLTNQKKMDVKKQFN